ncbi:MAG: hypothetical protein AB7Q29_04600 [Vicinamibacterales bacterium]
MATYIVSLLVLIAVVAGGFILFELYFTKRGRRAIMEQHRIEGNDEPPKTI